MSRFVLAQFYFCAPAFFKEPLAGTLRSIKRFGISFAGCGDQYLNSFVISRRCDRDGVE